MKSFRLCLSKYDRMLIMKLAYAAYRLKLYRLSIWLYCKVPPFGTMIASTMMIA